MEFPDQATFALHQGPGWRLQTAQGETVDVELRSVDALRPSGGPVSREPFSLEFQVPPGHGLPQGTYRFQHPEVGELSIFVVPVGADEEGLRMQAVFT